MGARIVETKKRFFRKGDANYVVRTTVWSGGKPDDVELFEIVERPIGDENVLLALPLDRRDDVARIQFPPREKKEKGKK